MKEGTKELQRVFGESLREIREAAGYSQERLALECGLDRTYISLLERGLRQPSLGTIFQLGRALRIRPSRLVAKVERRSG